MHIGISERSQLAGLYVGDLHSMSCLNTGTITLAIKMPNQREKTDEHDFFFNLCVFPFFFWPLLQAYKILAPLSGTKPEPLAAKSWSPNRWTSREFLLCFSLYLTDN